MRLRKKRSKTYLCLSDFANHNDLLSVVKRYLASRSAATYSRESSRSRKLLRVNKTQNNGRYACGIIETGEYGYEAILYDVNRKTVSYRRSTLDAEMLPFYFLINILRGRDEGILLLQRTGNIGIRDVLFHDLSEFIASQFPNVVLEINPLVPKNVVSGYLRSGKLKKVRFVRFTVPSDVTDAYDRGGHVEETGYVEYTVSARRGGVVPFTGRLTEVVNGNRAVTQMVELHDFDYDTVKVVLDIGGSSKTIDLSDYGKLRVYYDITDDVELGTNGHPEFDSIHRIAEDFMQNVSQLVAGVNHDVR